MIIQARPRRNAAAAVATQAAPFQARLTMEPAAPPPGPAPDPKAARDAMLNELTLWLHDALIQARRIAEIHFGAMKSPLSPHEMDAIIRTGTALFQTAVMLQAQQQTMQQVSKQFRGVEAPPEIKKALNDMMKKAPQIIDEMLKDTREGEEWKRSLNDDDEEDEPPKPPRRRRHPEDEPEEGTSPS